MTTEVHLRQRVRTSQRGAPALLKRGIDVIGAATLLVLLAPVFAVVAVIIRLDSRGPVFFHQQRVGRNHELFTIHKFRSMVADADPALREAYLRSQEELTGEGAVYKVVDDPRITKIGAIIRQLSIDELPQLWNVVRGEMSLVGPRPDVPYSLEQYETEHHRRFDVMPGLTGLWQVSGRSELSLRQMLDLDLEYVDRWSVALDLQLLARTIPELLRPERAA